MNAAAESQPAMRCNDWLHKIRPAIHNLAPRAHEWWSQVTTEARSWYDKWCGAGLLERAGIKGEPSEHLLSETYVRLEARILAMLCKAVPNNIYELALSARNTTCVGLIFLILKTYQPGGLLERSELLKGLTNLQVADSATTGVSVIQRWFRHLERARNMSVSVPDCSLLIDALDEMSGPVLEKHPTMLFRVHAIRMQLQLDTEQTVHH